jgi:hypothetical protein
LTIISVYRKTSTYKSLKNCGSIAGGPPLVIFSKFSPSTAGSHFQRTCGVKLKLLHFSKNWSLSVRCPLTIRARTSGINFAKFCYPQRGCWDLELFPTVTTVPTHCARPMACNTSCKPITRASHVPFIFTRNDAKLYFGNA